MNENSRRNRRRRKQQKRRRDIRKYMAEKKGKGVKPPRG